MWLCMCEGDCFQLAPWCAAVRRQCTPAMILSRHWRRHLPVYRAWNWQKNILWTLMYQNHLDRVCYFGAQNTQTIKL
ncbi:unnamed protein product [Peronospora farinosa]|uniref:Uncharacterized protein n=1 Tax=Peronospora farinosa TaxID=134698 RepID=A0ABN8BU54_9STRA|nr:unnamed protein product [Peronospora farinosa]